MKKIDSDDITLKNEREIADNVSRLQAVFPQAISEGSVNYDVLEQLLGSTRTPTDERFGLSWQGKANSRRLALTISSATLRPAPEHSVAWASTKNVLIEGDNLEALKLLKPSLAGKVSLVFIDPPYNTGEDFVYHDSFSDTIDNYLRSTGQLDGESMQSSSVETIGRRHSNWLSMIYPRLRLARELLSDDGAIYICIDETERATLQMICDEIFGEPNHVATFIWEKRTNRENRRVISERHDYILCYCKVAENMKNAIRQVPMTEKALANYKNPDNDPRGLWKSDPATAQAGHATKDQFYVLKAPNGTMHELESGRCWVYTEKAMIEAINDGRIWFGRDGNGVPRLKTYLDAKERGLVPETIWFADETATNESAKNDLKALFDGRAVFETPKPVELIKKTILMSAKSGIVLDFFAGSGTTAHAVMLQSAEDSSDRRFVLVQMPERCPPASEAAAMGFACVSDITRERLRRAGEQVRGTNPLFAGDLGFRVFKLDSSNVRAWDPATKDLANDLLTHARHDKSDRTELDFLYEVILKRGLDLCVPVDEKKIAGKTVFGVGGGILFCCFADSITGDEVAAVGEGIAAWKDELKPADAPAVIFKDSAFADDVAKANITETLRQHGIEDVRSL
jgi:adenine-specific DNA-methyltransferase